MPEKTTLVSQGREHQGDLSEDTWTWEGLFETDNIGLEDSLKLILETEERLVSLWPSGDKVGVKGYGGLVAPGGARTYSSRIGEMVVGRHDFVFQGKPAEEIYSLTPRIELTASKDDFDSVDMEAAFTSGLELVMHIFEVEGDWDVQLQESSNNSAFTDVETIADMVDADADSGRIKIDSAARDRYLRLEVERMSLGSDDKFVFQASIRKT